MNYAQTIEDITHPRVSNPDFPNAPQGWVEGDSRELAVAENITLHEDHWKAIRALQDYYCRAEKSHINVRELHDALDEMFHAQGGIKYVYTLFPAGPLAQGCRFAGLTPPAGAADKGFGSVV